jgi:hypothetical protein
MAAKFTASRVETALIFKIIERFERITDKPADRLSLSMDLDACHSNGCSLDLIALLFSASDFDLVHDVCGIQRHIDRETGKLGDCFLPRYTARHSLAAA